MPDRCAARVGDFGIIDDAGNTIWVADVLGCVEVIYRALQRGVAIAARREVPHGIQINLAQNDFAQHAVIEKTAIDRLYGAPILVGSKPTLVGGVGFAGGQRLPADRYCDKTVAGIQQDAALIGNADVGIVVRVSQPNY